MRRLGSRLSALEAATGKPLSEAARAWLGLRQPLTEDEQNAETPQHPVDLSGCSPELRSWLGVE